MDQLKIDLEFDKYRTGTQSLNVDALLSPENKGAFRYQPRTEIDQRAVNDYAEVMRDAGDYAKSGFPPIRVWEVELLDGKLLRIITDGNHRTRAAQQAGLESILTTLFNGSLEEADADAIIANREDAHQRVRMTNKTKNRLAERAVLNEHFESYSDKDLKVAIGSVVSEGLIAKKRRLRDDGKLKKINPYGDSDSEGVLEELTPHSVLQERASDRSQ